jgi:hypothetical protein
MWDNLENCEKCDTPHLISNDIWGKPQDYHQVPSPRIEGMMTFVEGCVTKS